MTARRKDTGVSVASPEEIPDPPGHIAIIMDGNGRWARERGKRRAAGHKAGADNVSGITTECARLGVGQLTLYAFSMENWRRPRTEVAALMTLLPRYLVNERPTMMKNNIRFRAIGRLHQLPKAALREVRKTERMTAANTGMVLCLALSYGGRAEIADAARAIAGKAAAGEIEPGRVTERTVGDHLYTAGMPDVDLLIRTAGEMRISNFLLWQSWYAESYIADVYWPDFSVGELHKAIREYGRRERKFGRVDPAGKRRMS
ncbi:MAG: isoprenyl transferase [Planctomycetota bacterium]